MFPSDDPRKKKLLELLNSHMLEYGKTLHTLANDKERLKEEWDRAEMEKEVFLILLPQKLKAVHDLLVALGVRERKPVEEFTARGVIKIKGKKKIKNVARKKKII